MRIEYGSLDVSRQSTPPSLPAGRRYNTPLPSGPIVPTRGTTMKILPLAAELNSVLEKEASSVLEMLSDLGRRFYFPRGIISQSAEAKAKAHRFNATIGIATEKGGPMHLPSLQQYFRLDPAEVYPYAPTGGKPALREAWREKQLRENPRMQGKETGLPIVTAALTHGLGLISELFVNPG